MRSSSTRRFFSALSVGLLLLGSTSCIEEVRVPLAVPLPVVGGARPATPQGLEFIAEFGDGVWGQEQERAEMGGAGIGVAFNDRIELSSNAYASSRGIKDSSGDEHPGQTSVALRGKVRLGDFADGRGAFGVHVAYSYAERERFDVQDERLSALDLAFPVEFYRAGGLFTDHRLGLYAAPRVVFERFRDQLTGELTKGTLAGGLVGVAARWSWFAAMGELNFARAPTMEFRSVTFEGGWHLLPMLSVRGLIPISR